MLADRRVEYSHSSSVSEYSQHFCVCNTNCGSFFLFVGKTGNAHTHGVASCRTNTLPVENRRGIDAPSCVPSGCSLPLSFKTFRSTGSTDSSPLVPGFITPGELKPFLHAGLPQPTLFPLITSHLPVGKFLELSQFIARLWKSKLTPWSLPPPRVHVLLRGLCGGKVRPLWSSSPLHCLLKISFFSSHGRVRADQNPPSVMRTAWYGWSKPPIRHADRMVWVNCLGMRERRDRSVTPRTDRTAVEIYIYIFGKYMSENIYPNIYKI